MHLDWGCVYLDWLRPAALSLERLRLDHELSKRRSQIVRPFNRLVLLAGFAALTALLADAQNISGDWQGTLRVGAQDIRLLLQIAKSDNGEWRATMLSIDQSPDRGVGAPTTSFSLNGSSIRFAIGVVGGSYDGKLSADGVSISGMWTQGRPLPLAFRRATKEMAWLDPSPHRTQFIAVENNVKLEVLDWGGLGTPLVLLAGLGNTAHVFDKFAPKLSTAYHVYGITRRGFGASSAPLPVGDRMYSADRLGDDVLAVLDALKLNRPVLVGHSLGGEELSSVGSRYPERVAGLIYLDAGYSYAYYDRSRGNLDIDLSELQKKLQKLQPGKGTQDPKALVHELLETTLPGFERDLKQRQEELDVMPPALLAQASSSMPEAAQAIQTGEQKYTNIPVPVLAIYAVPHDLGPLPGVDATARAAFEASDEAVTGAQAKAFESGVPSARVVRLPHANHYVFFSNEADVLREVNAFLGSLSSQN
jgi:non-heme chloroperoxidase